MDKSLDSELNDIKIDDLIGYDSGSTSGDGSSSAAGFSYEDWNQQTRYHQSNNYFSSSHFRGRDH